MILHIGDGHIGARRGNQIFREFIFGFRNNIIDYCIENGIKHIIEYGDTFDNPKQTQNMDIQYTQQWINKLESTDITVHSIVGNHEMVSTGSLKINTQRLLLDSKNIIIYDKPKDVVIDDQTYCMIPWICKDNEKECIDVIQNSKAEYCAGHFELQGFKMYRTSTNMNGMDPNILSKFKKVLSGHFHHQNEGGNIHYLGTPYHLTHQDVGDRKGVHLQDGKWFEFIENENSLFTSFVYDYDNMTDHKKRDYIDAEFIKNLLKDKIVKVIIKSKSAQHYAKFKRCLSSAETIDYTTVDESESIQLSNDDEVTELDSLLVMMNNYIEQEERYKDKARDMMNAINELYEEVYGEQKQINF